jgi:hypothetical protein
VFGEVPKFLNLRVYGEHLPVLGFSRLSGIYGEFRHVRLATIG